MQIKSDRAMETKIGCPEREQQRQGGSNFVGGGDRSGKVSLKPKVQVEWRTCVKGEKWLENGKITLWLENNDSWQE